MEGFDIAGSPQLREPFPSLSQAQTFWPRWKRGELFWQERSS